MSMRYHEIAESGLRVLNPFTADKYRLLGEVCRIQPDWKHLDLACGKGEMLATWADRYRTTGLGIDKSEVFLEAARKRAKKLDVENRVTFRQGDAADPDVESNAYDIVSCIGATWIGNGMSGTIDILKRALRPGGLMLIGDVYWTGEPDTETAAAYGAHHADTWFTLEGALDRIEAARMTLVQMVMGDTEAWDRFEAAQWTAMTEWLAANPGDPDAAEFRKMLDKSRRAYLAHGRRTLGWGVFVLKAA